MAAKRIKRLEATEEWAWTNKDQLWMNYYNKLKSFSERFGHCNVPKTYKIKGLGLTRWANRSRRDYLKSKLPQQQRQLLESLTGWSKFVKTSLLYISSLELSPTGQRIYKELDLDCTQSLSSLAQKSACSISCCSVYRKKYLKEQ